MEPIHNPNDFFSIVSPFDSKKYLCKEKDYAKEISKRHCFYQNEKIITKIHESVLEEEEFAETLQLFQSNVLNLPEYIDVQYVEPVVRYFYFLEIKEIKCQDVFELFKVASFLKVQELIKQIKIFLQKPLESKERALILFKNHLSSFFLFQ